MSEIKETREEWVIRVVAMYEEDTPVRVHRYLKEYFKVNRGSVLRNIASLSESRGLKSYFIDGDLSGLKQNFYVASKLIMAGQLETSSGLDAFGAYQPFLYGLLSDSPEIIDWLAHAELKNKDYVKGPHFRFHQFQLLLRRDDAALQETIARVAKSGGNRDRLEASSGTDFFSLVLKREKEALQTCIENAAKIKSADEYVGQFLAGYAVILAKLCWLRGVEVDIKNPLVPMPMLPVKPLDSYDVEYDFLRPDWIPPQPSLLENFKRWIKR